MGIVRDLEIGGAILGGAIAVVASGGVLLPEVIGGEVGILEGSELLGENVYREIPAEELDPMQGLRELPGRVRGLTSKVRAVGKAVGKISAIGSVGASLGGVVGKGIGRVVVGIPKADETQHNDTKTEQKDVQQTVQEKILGFTGVVTKPPEEDEKDEKDEPSPLHTGEGEDSATLPPDGQTVVMDGLTYGASQIIGDHMQGQRFGVSDLQSFEPRLENPLHNLEGMGLLNLKRYGNNKRDLFHLGSMHELPSHGAPLTKRIHHSNDRAGGTHPSGLGTDSFGTSRFKAAFVRPIIE
jgi:hypothetical protein